MNIHSKLFYLLGIVAYTLIYYFGGVLALALNATTGDAVLFWPPAGIALATLLLYGYRFLPGIFLGTFLATIHYGPVIAAAAGLGSTLGPLIGVSVLKRFFAFNSSLDRVHDVMVFIFVASAISSTTLAVLISTGVIFDSGFTSGFFKTIWRLWIANFMSDVIVGSFLMSWLSPSIQIKKFKLLEFLLLVSLVIFLSVLIFTDIILKPNPLMYLVFVPLVWAGLRFGQRFVSAIVLIFSILLVWSITHGSGPFAQGGLAGWLFYSQGFMIVTAVTSMIFAAAIAESTELNRRKNNFIGIASHELKTPLTSIKIIAQLLKKTSKRGEKEAEYLNTMDEQVDKLTGLVKSLLNLSKIQAGKLTLNKEFVWLREIINENVETIRLAESTHKIVMEGKISNKVYVDKDRIGQVIMNLLTNAIKHSPDSKKVIVTLSEKGGFAQVAVQDFGYGIPNEKLSKIFELYYQFPQAENEGGLGLGLFISSEIIKKHQGKIWVKSEEGKGSTFYFTLPFGKVL